jgi:hypothetical protein
VHNPAREPLPKYSAGLIDQASLLCKNHYSLSSSLVGQSLICDTTFSLSFQQYEAATCEQQENKSASGSCCDAFCNTLYALASQGHFDLPIILVDSAQLAFYLRLLSFCIRQFHALWRYRGKGHLILHQTTSLLCCWHN